jgi:hypothetical protein
MLSYDAAKKIVFKAAKKAGIEKRVNLHKFRASRATHLVTEGMSEPVLCEFGGWKIGSAEIRTYVKLSGKNVEDEILKINGLIKEEDKKNKFKIKICPRCGVKNEPVSKFCHGCSLGLDEITLLKFDKQKDSATDFGFNLMDLMNDHDFLIRFGNLLAEEYQKLKK